MIKSAIEKWLHLLNEKQNTLPFREILVHQRPQSMHQLRVVRCGNQLQLRFYGEDSSEIISRLNENNPLDLLSPYTQASMLALMWQENPRRVYMLGFGAGRIPMILHHYFPELVIEATELDKDVLEVACGYFGAKLDHRLLVAIEDGRKYLEEKTSYAAYDIIFIDASRGTSSSPFPLATQEFYTLCKRHLSTDGLVSINLLPNDSLYRHKVGTLAASFRNVYLLQTDWGNSILFASDADSIPITELMNRAARIQANQAFIFPFLEHLRGLKQIIENSQWLDPAYQSDMLSDRHPPSALYLPKSAIGRSRPTDSCPCGSGKEYQNCHGASSND